MCIRDRYNIPYVYIEQGIWPQNENLRLMLDPIHEETHLGITIEGVNVLPCSSQKRDFTKGKVCIVAQVLHDSSLYKLKKPKEDFENLVNEFLKTFEYTDLVLCPHPKSGPVQYDGLPKHRVSKKKTSQECKDAECVIGFNSTFLCEAVILGLGREVIALDPLHVLNSKYVIHENLVFFVDHCQFNPAKIKFTELVRRFRNL